MSARFALHECLFTSSNYIHLYIYNKAKITKGHIFNHARLKGMNVNMKMNALEKLVPCSGILLSDFSTAVLCLVYQTYYFIYLYKGWARILFCCNYQCAGLVCQWEHKSLTLWSLRKMNTIDFFISWTSKRSIKSIGCWLTNKKPS